MIEMEFCIFQFGRAVTFSFDIGYGGCDRGLVHCKWDQCNSCFHQSPLCYARLDSAICEAISTGDVR